MAKKILSISDQMRQAILAADKTRYRIAKECGIAESQLTRFVHGKSGLRLDTLDKIGECLGGVELIVAGAPIKRKRGK